MKRDRGDKKFVPSAVDRCNMLPTWTPKWKCRVDGRPG
jgi:hypothetical protein